MRTYAELSEQEQARAREVALGNILQAVVEGDFAFFSEDELGTELQAKIDAGIVEAERLQTPWFAGECIMERCGPELTAMAGVDAEGAVYPGPEDYIIKL